SREGTAARRGRARPPRQVPPLRRSGFSCLSPVARVRGTFALYHSPPFYCRANPPWPQPIARLRPPPAGPGFVWARPAPPGWFGSWRTSAARWPPTRRSMPTVLTGSFLVAKPILTDPNFSQSVVLILGHGGGGAFGVIVNRPVEAAGLPFPVHHGGPCPG